MRYFVLIVALFLAACVQPHDAPVKVFVGAALVDPAGGVVTHSVVIVSDGIVTAAGPQADVPVPTGSHKINGLGLFLFPLDPKLPIREGAPAAFGLYRVNPLTDPAYAQKAAGLMRGANWEPQG
jgi:hypothetical protein